MFRNRLRQLVPAEHIEATYKEKINRMEEEVIRAEMTDEGVSEVDRSKLSRTLEETRLGLAAEMKKRLKAGK